MAKLNAPILTNPRNYDIDGAIPDHVSVSSQKYSSGRILVTATIMSGHSCCINDMVQVTVPTAAKRMSDAVLQSAIEEALPTLRTKVEAKFGVTF